MWRLPVNLRRQWLVRRLARPSGVAVLHASQQPQEVHAASTVRLPGAEELLQDRLSRCRRAVARSSGAARCCISIACHISRPCRRPVATCLPPRRCTACSKARFACTTAGAGAFSHRPLTRPAWSARRPAGILCGTPTRLVALENRSLSSLSEARPGMRHELPLHPLDSRRSRSAPRCGRAGAAAHRCRAFGADRLPGGRRGLRL